MNIISLLLLFVTAVNFLLAIFVFANNRKKLINIFFSITIAGAAFWDLTIYFFVNSSADTVNFWMQSTYFSVNFAVVFFLLFSFFFPYGSFPKNIFTRIFIFISVISFYSVTLIPHFIARENFYFAGELKTIFGVGYYIHSIIVFTFYAWAFKNLYVKFKSSEGIIRSQLLYLSVGIFLTFSISLITNLIVYPFTTNFAWLGPVTNIFLSISVAYSITRYRLMDIKVVLRRGAVVVATLVTLALIFGGAIMFLSKFSGSNIDTPSFAILIVVALSIFLMNNLIKERITNIFNKLFFAPLYNKEVVLNELAQRIPKILDFEELVDVIIKTTQSILQIEKISLWSINRFKKEFVELKSVGFTGKENNIFVSDDELLKYFLAYNEPVVYHEIGNISDNEKSIVYNRILSGLKNKMEERSVDIIIPLFFKRNVIGMMFLGKKIDDTSYSREDINVLKVIVSQSAVAIDNAKLYTEIQQFADKMKKEVRRATSELRQVNKQLTKLDKAKSEFISIASHQLRTPLTAIKGYASMILDGDYGKVNKSIRPAIDRIFIGANRMSTLVENLLNVSRIESGKIVYNMRDVDFKIVVDSLVKKFKVMAYNKKLKLDYICIGNNFHINADEVKVMQVVSNIIDNAVKYTEEGGIEVKLELASDGTDLILSVKDTGVGIDKEDMLNVFQKFTRGKKVTLLYTDGLGLGMFFSKKIVEAHKGKIWVESEGDDKGSTFYVRLPVLSLP